MEMDGLDEVYKLQRFVPTPQEAVGYFLRRLLTGETLHGAEKLINRADIYACEPKDLAKQFHPVPTAVSTGDRFFFTTLRHGKNGWFARVAGAGTWMVQKTEDIFDEEGVKVGEFRSLSFKKGKDKATTGWVMKEYRCLLPEAVVAGGEMVLCKIHLAPSPPAAARQESDAYKLRRQQGAEPHASARAHKRPAPVADADVPSCKKMRVAAPVPEPEAEVEYEDCPTWFTDLAAAAEADDDTGRLSCTLDELLGEQQPLPIEAENNVQHLVLDQDMEGFQEQESTQTHSLQVQDEDMIPQLVSDDQDLEWGNLDIEQLIQILASDRHAREEAELQMKKSCNHNADLQGQHNNFFSSFAPVNL